MTRHQVQNIRNIAFCGHGGAGKTTLVDQLLLEIRRRDGPAQRGRRHEHLRLRCRGEAAQALH